MEARKPVRSHSLPWFGTKYVPDRHEKKQWNIVPIADMEEIRARQNKELISMLPSFDNMHKDVLEKATKTRREFNAAHDRQTGVRAVESTDRDLVMWNTSTRKRNKGVAPLERTLAPHEVSIKIYIWGGRFSDSKEVKGAM